MHDEAITGATASGVVARARQAETNGPFPLGTTLAGAYELKHVLGAGGMGVVYAGFDRGLARRVAIKAALSSVFAASLRSEAHTLAALRSPSFVEVYALASHDGIDFIVMERLFGERLDRRIDDAIEKRTVIPITEVIDILIGLAKALVAAHAAGVSQRDVKPSNTILAGDRVVLFDFGLAIPEVLAEPTTLISGSIDYIAPELVLGSIERGRGAHVDLYALGVTAYELLTNATPFAGGPAEQTLSRHVGEAPRDVRERRTDVPVELAELVNDLLEKDPEDRPASAEAVLWRLDAMKNQGASKSKRFMNVLTVAGSASTGATVKQHLESRFSRLAVQVATEPQKVQSPPGNGAPDVVLLDLDLPNHNCVETCAELLAPPPSQRPVVVGLGQNASTEDVALLRALGVHDVIPKNEDLIGNLTKIIGRLRDGSLV